MDPTYTRKIGAYTYSFYDADGDHRFEKTVIEHQEGCQTVTETLESKGIGMREAMIRESDDHGMEWLIGEIKQGGAPYDITVEITNPCT